MHMRLLNLGMATNLGEEKLIQTLFKIDLVSHTAHVEWLCVYIYIYIYINTHTHVSLYVYKYI